MMSKKRDLLLNTALKLFYQHGINSIGVNEVIKVSGVAKKTLYSHFSGKEALIMAALEQRHDTFITWLENKLAKSSNDDELIQALFGALQNWFEGNETVLGDFRGCFFINSSAEFSDPQSDVFRYCSYHKAQVQQLIKSKLSQDSPELLNAICLLKEGAITTAYMTGKSADVIQTCVDILQQLAHKPSNRSASTA
ncbi:TetR/AcrR family transcriptional regulator [Litorilituus sediminis]|nr:TetR/AcrR family transcriptional regulator [Litorilituus sediminis]